MDLLVRIHSVTRHIQPIKLVCAQTELRTQLPQKCLPIVSALMQRQGASKGNSISELICFAFFV